MLRTSSTKARGSPVAIHHCLTPKSNHYRTCSHLSCPSPHVQLPPAICRRPSPSPGDGSPPGRVFGTGGRPPGRVSGALAQGGPPRSDLALRRRSGVCLGSEQSPLAAGRAPGFVLLLHRRDRVRLSGIRRFGFNDAGLSFVAVDRKDYSRLYRAVRCRQDAEPSCLPPVCRWIWEECRRHRWEWKRSLRLPTAWPGRVAMRSRWCDSCLSVERSWAREQFDISRSELRRYPRRQAGFHTIFAVECENAN
jgi:hypothetical protein